MQDSIDRKAFFKKGLLALIEPFVGALEDLANISAPRGLRPPGAVEESLFLRLCTKCDECIKACPQSSIRRAAEKDDVPEATPVIHPQEGPCYLCDSLYCIKACREGALRWVEKQDIRMGIALVDKKRCFAWTGEDSSCDNCYVRCPFPEKAIILVKGGGPVVKDGCVGCGLCEYYCVSGTKAIRIVPFRGIRKSLS